MKPINTNVSFKLFKKLGKFHNVRDQEYDKAEDVYSHYVQLMQIRGNLATLIKQAEKDIELKFMQIEEVDKEIKAMGIHIPEITKMAKEEYERRKKERDKKIDQGPKQKPVFKRERDDPKDQLRKGNEI